MTTVDVRRAAIRYGERFVNSQLDLGATASNRFTGRKLAVAMHARISELRHRALQLIQREGALRHGYGYIVVAEPTASP